MFFKGAITTLRSRFKKLLLDIIKLRKCISNGNAC